MPQLTQLTTTPLKTTHLEGTGLEITRVGFGASAIVQRLQTVAARHHTTPGAVAAAWTLHHPDIDNTNQPGSTR